MGRRPTAGVAVAVVEERLRSRSAIVGVLGLGYVGLPVAIAFAEAGFKTLGFEVDARRLRMLAEGQSYVGDVASEALRRCQEEGRFASSRKLERLAEPDALLICLPTPLSKARDPDLAILTKGLSAIAKKLRRNQLVVLTSTTYPGTTEELVLPILESSGLRAGKDFFLAYSPERMDPGNRSFSMRETPRVVAGISPDCSRLASLLLSPVSANIHQVANCRTAEITKLLENTFRSVNIALVNEMAMICRKLNIDIWEVLDAASTKPFGYTRFEPGPGLGGHCIPVDPAYLAWRLRMFNYRARFVELAEDINQQMPEYVSNLVAEALDAAGQPVRGARILALGIAYKPDVSDARESPSVEVVRHLIARGALISVHDPYLTESPFPGIPVYGSELSDGFVGEQDCVLILTAHSVYRWDRIVRRARLVVDTRGVTRHVAGGNVVRL